MSYVYDDPAVSHSIGQLTQVANGSSVTKYVAYDALGRVTTSQQLTSDEAYNFSYTYNFAGALTSETYPSGRVVTASYDQADRDSAIMGVLSGVQTNYATGATYAPHGGIAGSATANGVTPWFGYNNRLQVATAQATVGSGASAYLFVEQPSWGTTNNDGNLVGETVWKGGPAPLSSLPQATRSYSYDTLSRLTAASDSTGWSRQFGYDTWGNMWVTANSGVNLARNTPTSNVYNSNNQMGGASYDAAGNLLLANGFTLGYDAENRQVSATEQPSLGGGQELYLYDGEGQRVEKVAPAGNTVYVYDAFGELAAEYNTFESSFACTTCYVTTDHLGSVRMVTDQNGAAVTRHDYLPFGEEIPGNSPGSDVEQRFTGQIRDTETGMDFFNARYFTGPLARFNSTDPESAGADLSDPQTWNGYAYVRNSPLVYTDPSGQFLSSAAGAAAGGPVGAVIGGIIDIFAALFGLFGGGGGSPPPTFSTTVWASPGQTAPAPSSVGSSAGVNPGVLVIPGLVFTAEATAKADTQTKTGTKTCVGPAMFSAVGPKQARGNGALFSKTTPYSIRGGTNGTVAVQNGFLGFTRAQLRQYGSQIFVSPQDGGAISKSGGPTGPYTVSDLGDQNIQNASGVRFDIYRWRSNHNALRFGLKQFNTQVTFPIAAGGSCPSGWEEQ